MEAGSSRDQGHDGEEGAARGWHVKSSPSQCARVLVSGALVHPLRGLGSACEDPWTSAVTPRSRGSPRSCTAAWGESDMTSRPCWFKG